MKPALRALLDDPHPAVDRRSFCKRLGIGAGAAIAMTGEAAAATAADFVQSNVNRASEPSALKITDLRVAVVTGAPFTVPIIRIDTNQGLSSSSTCARTPGCSSRRRSGTACRRTIDPGASPL